MRISLNHNSAKFYLLSVPAIVFLVIVGIFFYPNEADAVCTYTSDYCACGFLDDYFNFEWTHAAQHVASQESSCKSNLCECSGAVCPAWPGEGATCEVQGVGLFQLRHFHCGVGPLSSDHQQCYSDRLDPGKNSAATAVLTSGGQFWEASLFGGAACFTTLGEDTCPTDPNKYCPEKDSADGTWECPPPCDTPVAMANNRHRINNTLNCYINRHSVCKDITNNSGSNLFVGSNQSFEWSSFYNNPPAGVSISSCGCNLPGVCPAP